MALRLRRLPEPVDWVAPTVDALPPPGGALARAALRLRLDSTDAPFPAWPRDGGPVVSLRTPASTGSGDAVPIRWTGTPPGVRAAARAFPSSARVTFERAGAMVRALSRDLGLPATELDPEHHALICLAEADGAAGLVATALAQAAPGLSLVGGTFPMVALDGAVRRGGSVVALVAGEAPVRAFQAHPFTATDARTIVTACDEGGLLVRELDGFPAAARFADLAGREIPDAPPDTVLADLDTQLAWVACGRLLLRPVVGRRGAALVVASPVQPGLVLRVVRRDPRPAATLLDEVERALSAHPTRPSAAWAFACRGFLAGRLGASVRDGLLRMGVVACAVNGAYHGPVHSSGMVAGLVFGDAGSR